MRIFVLGELAQFGSVLLLLLICDVVLGCPPPPTHFAYSYGIH